MGAVFHSDGKDLLLGAARQRRLRQLRADVRQALDDILALKAAWGRLADAAAQRPSTPTERQQARALEREGLRLRFQLRRLRAELERVEVVN